jgi:AmmeMemoRadiSam system protein B/AmmeMemoRadiSam system protein A
MRKKLIASIVFLIFATSAALLEPASPLQAAGEKVRRPEVAGSFYPANPQELGRMLDGFLAKANPEQPQGQLIALSVPHAGYEFSGQVAAYAFALLKGRKFARVVVISPCHIEAFPFSSVYDGDAYATPLGKIPVDKEFAKKLVGQSSLIQFSGRGHGEVNGRGEHSLEVELPFLQRTLGEFKLVPIVMGEQNYDTERDLGVALARLIKAERKKAAAGSPPSGDTLIVASSDLSHYHPYDEAVRLDHKVLNAITEWDYFNMSQNFERRVWEACGGGPIVATMIAAERLGANRARVLKYANSGDVTGDKSRVVGYGAVVYFRESGRSTHKAQAFSLSQKEKEALLKIAKESVYNAVKERKLYQCSSGGLQALEQDRGAFVTLKEKGRLRGCIGYIAPMKPLCLTVRDVAAAAALEDPRFRPVEFRELPQLEYEVSVLSPLRRVTDIKQIKVGEHGLVMRRGDKEGLLLPQVPVEEHWNRTTFLEQTCVKAGLPTDAWKDPDTDIFMFSALVFGDHSPSALSDVSENPFPTREPRPGQTARDSLHP